jgi:type IV pilus secretin PilQ/predicted competence protein
MKTNWPAFRCGCLIVASVVLGGGLANVRAQESAGATSTAAVISSVAITQEPQRAAIRVEGAGRLDVHPSRMQNPERLVLDFSGARLAVQRTVIPGVSAPVRGVRIGQFRPDVARVVVDLTGETPYQIAHEGEAVVVYFQMQVTPDANVVAPVTSTSADTTKKTVAYAANPAKPEVHAKKVSNAPAPKFALPKELTEPSVVLATLHEKSEPVRPDDSGQQASQQAAQLATTAATTVAVQQQATMSPAAAQTGRYTGEPISVNLKDVDLKDFFRLIHEISGLNVVLDPNVKGTLTIVLDEVPWDQALDIVLQNNSLDKQLTGNVLRVATRDTLKKEAETKRDLEKAQAEAVAPVTVTRVLSYAKAATLKDTLKKFLSTRGDILSDDRSNQLIIRDIPSVIPTIDNLIRQLDRKSQQVEIEARVVAASRTFAQDIGVQWGFAGTTTSGRSIFGGPSSVGVSPVTTTGIPAPPLVGTSSSSGSSGSGLPFNVNLGANAPTSGFYFGHRSPNFAVDLFITAAESKGVGKLLSKPKVITQNNEKATVKQGTKIPIQTTINNTISVQYIDAVLKLEVTPQITAEGTVFLDVLVENTQIDNGIPLVQGIPALDTQAAQTRVTVPDGGTVVIGGIIVTQQQKSIKEVPIIGSLPLIGYLFRETSVTVQSQELLFFITPRIIPG